jgi:single-strand DNA-binding protein
MNKVILCGNISTDIDFKTTSGGTPVARFSLAVKNMKGVDFIPIVTWNQVADNVSSYCNKGSKILVEGRIQNNSYEKDGQKKYTTDVVADRLEFLEKKEGNPYKDMSIKTDSNIGNQIEITDDDLPW